MKRAFPIWFLFLVALVAPAAAQSLDLTRARVPGGGGVSAGGQFTLFSTVAQTESAARVAGGAFTLDSGFLGATLPSPIPTVYFPSGTVTVLEDSGAQTRASYATFEPGDAGPPAQPATFQLSNNNAALFSAPPAMDTSRTLTFTPAPNANGTATVTVVVRADGVDVATNSFSIVVTAVNDAPAVTLAGNQSVLEDVGPQTVSSFATFSPGPANESAQTPAHTLTADNPALFSAGPAVAANGTLTYTPAANANGSATITVVTSDGGGMDNSGVDRATNTFTIIVTAVNDAPSVAYGTNNVVVLEDAGAQSVGGFATFTAGPADESAQTATYTLTAGNPGLFSVQPALAANGTLTFTPAPNANGAATITVITADGGGAANGGVDRATNTFTITVTAVNDAPVATYATNNVTVLEDAGAQTFSGFATFSAGPADETAQTPAYTLTADNPALFSAQPALAANGTLTFTPAANANGSATVTVVVADTGATANGGVDRSTNTFTITITAVNDAPGVTLAQSTVTVLEDAGAQSLAGFATFSPGPANEAAQALVGYTVSHNNSALFSVAPALAANGTLSFTPAANANGSATVTVIAQDSGGTTDGGVDTTTNTFTITVTAVNDAPSVAFSANPVVVAIDSGPQTVSGFATFSPGPADEAAQTPAYTVTTDNAALFSAAPVIAANGTLTFTTATGVGGAATVTVVVQDTGGITDGGVDKATNTFTLSVLTFAGVADSYTMAEDATLTRAAGTGVLANDIGPMLHAVLVATTTNGLLTLNLDGSFTYQPATNFFGTDHFTYLATNSADTSAVTIVSLTVTSLNDAPVVTLAQSTVTILEDSGASSLPGFATFSPGPANESAQAFVSYKVSNSSNALFSAQPAINSAGVLTFTPATNANGSATVTVVTQDSGGTTGGGVDKTTNIFTIAMTMVNDAPSFTFATNYHMRTVAWGSNVNGTTNVPVGLNAALGFAACGEHILAVSPDGTVAAWGLNDAGQTSVPAGLVGVTAVAAGERHSLALKNDGTVVGWGLNADAQTSVPVELSGVMAISAGGKHSLALKSDGTVVAWGQNLYGESTVPAGLNGVMAIAAGYHHSVALKTDGTVVVWGYGGNGEKDVPAGLANVTAIAAGYHHILALKNDGTVVAWGYNTVGQATVPAGLSGVQAVTAGFGHSIVLKNDGTVVAWGINNFGQTSVPAGLSGVTKVVAGGVHAVALATSATASVNVLEDNGAFSAANFVTNISAGPANESSQTVSFTVTSDNFALFSTQPAVATDGTLTFTPAANANGTASVTIVAQDDGGTANGGVDKHTNTFSVVVTPVNDAPVVMFAQATVTVLEDAGAQSLNAFATFSPGPANESAQVLVGYTVTVNNASLLAAAPVINNAGVLTFTPAANANGSATVTVVVQDNGGTGNGGVDKSTNTFTIAVNAVNDAPSVTFTTNLVALLEDAGPQSVAGFATFTAGPANESAQALAAYTVSNSSNALFSVPPAIDNAGRLTFTSAANANGSVTVTVVVQDNSAVADGGVDKSTNTFTLTVTPVNDAPSVTFAQSTVTVLEDAGAQSVSGFATFSPGPANESAQPLVGYSVTMNNAALFSSAPAINNSGVLTFTPAAHANGSATVTVVVQDNGGTANGGVDKSTNTFTIAVTAVNDTPVANPDSYTMNQGDVLAVAAGGVLANDTDVENSVLTATKLTNPAHGTVTLNANGGFTYTPDTNFHGVDSYTYRVSDGGLNSGAATVSITVLARPVITPPPGKQRVFSSAALRFSATNAPDLNAIRVSDPDSSVLTLSLTVTNGTLGIAVTNGLAFPNGFTNTNSLVLTGLITNLNDALESLSYRSVTNYFGDDTLVLVAQDEGGRTNRGNGEFAIQVEIPARGPSLEVPLTGYNNPGMGRTVTNATAVTLDTNLVQGITYDPTNNVVRVQPVGGQDGATNRSSVTVLARYSDGTTELITVPVIIYNPLLTTTTNSNAYDATFTAPLFNLQTSLYEQKVRVQNNTPFDFTALRITATNLPATVTLQNATLTNGGLPYIEYNLAVAAGSNVTLKLEYFSSDLAPFTPGLRLELLNQQRTNATPTDVTMSDLAARRGFSPDGATKNYLKFPTQPGRLYYVQYQDVVGPVWKTSPVVLRGTGFVLNWMDDGPPNTETPPGPVRFYRVVTER